MRETPSKPTVYPRKPTATLSNHSKGPIYDRTWSPATTVGATEGPGPHDENLSDSGKTENLDDDDEWFLVDKYT